jgi:hypothetical protein
LAQAEHQKAQAEFAKAQAEKEKAQAQHYLAQAEYQKAQAELAKAKAEEQLVQAERTKILLEQEKAALALELAGQAEKLEAELWIAKTNLFNQEQAYLSTLNGVNTAKREKLQQLLGTYTTAAISLIEAQKTLADLNQGLVELENDLVDLQTAKAKEIIKLEKQIADKEATKANFEKYATADRAEVQKAMDAVSLEIGVLMSSQAASGAALVQPEADFNAIRGWFEEGENNKSEYYNKFATVLNNARGIYEKDGDYVYDVTDKYDITTQVTLYTGKKTKEILVPYTFEEGGKVQNYITDEITEFYTVQKTEFDAYIKAYEEYVAGFEKEGGSVFDADAAYKEAQEDEAETKKAVDEAKTAKDKADEEYEVADKAFTAADKAVIAANDAFTAANDAYGVAVAARDALPGNATEAQKSAAETAVSTAFDNLMAISEVLNAAVNTLSAANTTLSAANTAKETADSNYTEAFNANKQANETTVGRKLMFDSANEQLDIQKKDLAKVKEAYAYVTGKEQVDLVEAKIKSYNELAKKVADLQINVLKADKARDLKEDERNVLYEILNRSTDFATEIAWIDEAIEDLQDQIETVEAIETQEGLIKNQQVAIEKQELEVAKLKKERDIAKENLEEATAGAAADTATGEE